MTKRTLDHVDYVITVSENMFKQLLDPREKQNFGLRESILKLSDDNRVIPILNGIDSKAWDPKDPHVIPPSKGSSLTFSISEIDSGKRRLKTLLKEMGYFSDDLRPLVTFVGRFSDEKGIEHLHAAAAEIIGLGGNFAVMGSYGKSYNSRQMIKRLIHLSTTKPFLGKLLIIDSVEKQKQNALGQYVRAASDFSFVPSKEETCGLVPIEFFGFGALAITSLVGGLKDTIVPYEAGKEFFNGFSFNYENSDELYWTLREAFKFIRSEPERFSEIQKRIMKDSATYDWSTQNGAVNKILSLYKRAVSS